jgi:nitroimidazol reductase NimA-like FMN-containing flavoprotein (pyridoxamine 5'-phosphate oxidase superfamily)
MGVEEDEFTTRLTTEECWELLRADEFGRLAFRMVDEVHLVPINYAVDGDTLLFRTSGGNKLLGVTMHPEVVFEIDSYDDEHAHSVIVRGIARRLEEDEEHRAELVPLRPWVATPKYNVVEIRPTEITGRAFTLNRPWLHLRDDGPDVSAPSPPSTPGH